MPDILVVHSDKMECDFIDKLGREYGFRTKTAYSIQVAEDWLRMNEFAAAIVTKHLSVKEQKRLADLLWCSVPEAPFVIFDFEPGSEIETGEARLLGAEIALGADAMKELKRVFDMLSSKKRIDAQEFRILIVEDLDSPRYIISVYVEELGFPLVSGTDSAKKALAELESDPNRYSCIITDLRMPEMNGQELIEKIRENPKLLHLPIIVLTAWGTSDALVDCLKAGASGFLVKPPKKTDMRRELARARRIAVGAANPRLASPEEAEGLRTLLISKGLA